MDSFKLLWIFIRDRWGIVLVIALIGLNFSASALMMYVSIRSSGNIPVMTAYAIDQKIDDGLPTSGTVQAVYLDGDIDPAVPIPANNSLSDSATSCYNTTANTYSVGFNKGSGRNCAMSFRFQ